MIKRLTVILIFNLVIIGPQFGTRLLSEDGYNDGRIEHDDNVDEGSEVQEEPNVVGRGSGESNDPTSVPFRSLRNRRRPPDSSGERRRGFQSSSTNVSPQPQGDQQLSPTDPPSIKTATGKDASQQSIVVAGPDYNKEHEENVPSDIKPTLVENFDFHDVELNDVVKAISKLTKKNFILGEKLRGRITIISPASISLKDAWRAFLTALQINDYTTVESGAYIKVVRRNEARYTNIKTYSGKYSPDSDNIITRFINLKYIDAGEVAQTLQELVSRGGGRIFAYDRTNTLIITDAGTNINRLIKIIQEMDVAGFEEKLDIIKVHYASASEIAEKIAVITERDDQSRGRVRGGRPQPPARRMGDSRSPAEFHGKIIPDDRTNSLIVLATDSNLKKLRKLLEKIDYATKTSAASNIHIHYLQNATAEEVAATLTGITGDRKGTTGATRAYVPGRTRTGTPPSPGATGAFSDSLFTGNIKINADKPTNSLVIIASQQDYEGLKEIIAKLDIRRKQVFVEAIIAEVNINKGRTLGASASSVDEKRGIFSFGQKDFNSLSLLTDPMSLFAGGGLVGGITKGEHQVKIQGQEVTVGKFNLVLKALYGNSDTNVLSTPQILTTDNEEAEIVVGEKIPFLDTTTQTAVGTTQNIQRQDVGVRLKIHPQINETSEYVKLKIEQEASDVSSRTIQGMPSNVGPATLQRSTKTTVIVKDQDMVVIGGLIRDKISESQSKVPILGDVPLIGWLFRHKETTVDKTNLLLFIKPTIIGDYSDLRKVYHEAAENRREFVTKAYGEEDVHQKFIDERDKIKIDTTIDNN